MRLVILLLLLVSCVASQPRSYIFSTQRTYNLEDMSFTPGLVQIVVTPNATMINGPDTAVVFSTYSEKLKTYHEGTMVSGYLKDKNDRVYHMTLNLSKRYITIAKVIHSDNIAKGSRDHYLWYDGLKEEDVYRLGR